ncbi:MAG: PDZ domain-containing protein [Vicinamibacterales bacterium]|nr:PDZ domain-containing protein [Vicinamibacterales bacterium]MDP7473054.1 PDZ domain-containing protein [Vicinamibacterales bacterium]MDP7670912.1 PDZ domain-containing protein [Vicinamibacterales bacterium]
MRQLIRAGMALVLICGAGEWMVAGAAAQDRTAPRDQSIEATQFNWNIATGGARIGVSIRDIDTADVERESLESASGAVVESVTDDSPADAAGVRAGDVILGFDGERVRSARQLTRLVRETPVGRAVDLTVQRAGARHDLEITPDTRTASAESWLPVERFERLGEDLGRRFENFSLPDFDLFRARRPRLGIGAEELTAQLAEYFGVEAGVLVTHVEEGSAAEAAGLRAGDVITAVDGEGVDDVSELRRRLREVDGGEEFPLAVTRDRNALSLGTTLPEPETPERRRRANRQPLE